MLKFVQPTYKTSGLQGSLPTPITVVDPLVILLVAMSQGPQLTASNASTDEIHSSLIRRSWHAMSELLSPFSQGALAQLPKKPARPSRYTRANEIPDVEPTEEDGQMPTVRDYHSITVPPQVRVPKKTPTPVRVEGKVWFANERSPYPILFLFSFKALDPVFIFIFICRLLHFQLSRR